jgi:hypothetical protein
VLHAEELWRTLGRGAGICEPDAVETTSKYFCEEIVVEEKYLSISGQEVPAILTRPAAGGERRPAVLYCHAHGNRYDVGCRELLHGGAFLAGEPYGVALARRGVVSMCLDMPCFGKRALQGESQYSKALLWSGQTLFGQMLSELSAGVSYLMSRQDVDPVRISTVGMSMGGTHAYWLAALDQRISAVVQICVFSNIEDLIGLRANDRHGIYYMVPGLLAHGDAGDIAGMVAPRPQLICVGAKDRLTPPEAFEPALRSAQAAYLDKGASGRLKVLVSRDTAHCETQEMRDAVLKFLNSRA